jgi:glucose/arabinose dehydrogenase
MMRIRALLTQAVLAGLCLATAPATAAPPEAAGAEKASPSLAARYRLYNPATLAHLYTTSEVEYAWLSNRIDPACCGWKPEGPTYRLLAAPDSFGGVAAVPYYRLYNPAAFQHHWTSDPVEYGYLATVGWQQEGIDGYILPAQTPGTFPLHRLYLNAFGGLHLWTTDENERSVLSGQYGWTEEGVAGYVVPLPVPKAYTLNAKLASPWGMVFLPDGRMLVTQKGGTPVILSATGTTVESTVTGLPPVDAGGQGGLLDVALDPDFGADPWVYWTYAEPGTGNEAGLSGTAVARGRLVGSTLQDVTVIFRQVPKLSGGGHFGSRLAFRSDKTLFVTLGERQYGSPAQDLATTLGKVVRINRDGTLPPGNPAIPGARPEIWSYGHRNPQGAAIRPGGDELWLNEHGPQGGDELNRIVPGGNYGWPLVSYGCNYGDPVGEACRIGGGTHAPTYVEPVSYWVPTSVAPAGLLFYTANRFPQWKGHAFMGALAGTALWRVELAGNSEAARERLLGSLGERIRDVEQGPDGWIYLLTDSGKLIQVRE